MLKKQEIDSILMATKKSERWVSHKFITGYNIFGLTKFFFFSFFFVQIEFRFSFALCYYNRQYFILFHFFSLSLYFDSVKIFSIWIANDYRPINSFGNGHMNFICFFFLSFNWQLLSDECVKNNIKSSIFRMEGEHA